MGIRVVAGVAPGEPQDVERSVAALRGCTPGVEIVQLGAPGGAGFDELIGHPSDVVVLVEAGAVVAPRCIALLVGALERTGAGMAGPSTNLAWNEQSAVAAVGREPTTVDREAGLLLRRFGYAVRALDPPTLGDFCLAVRSDVVTTIGGADPAYGDGPRWSSSTAPERRRPGTPGSGSVAPMPGADGVTARRPLPPATHRRCWHPSCR